MKTAANDFVETFVAAKDRRRPGIVRSQLRPRIDAISRQARFGDFISLMKPRVMLLAIFTALVGLMIAPGALDPLAGLIAILAIATGAGAAGALNMWYDADIDALMRRTAMRAIPRGRITRKQALVFGLSLATGAVALLGLAANFKAAALLGFAIFLYVVVYTMWLKRRTAQNIVIGGAAGALPPVIGWTAATGTIGLEPLVLFLIVFLWTPPHFWALSLNRAGEYARAGIPMMPVVAGKSATARQILAYSLLLVPASLAPWALGSSGPPYGAVATVCGAAFILLACRLARSPEGDRRSAHRLFVFSIAYLSLLFAALWLDHARDPWASFPSPVTATRAAAERPILPTCGAGAGCSAILVSTYEV